MEGWAFDLVAFLVVGFVLGEARIYVSGFFCAAEMRPSVLVSVGCIAKLTIAVCA